MILIGLIIFVVTDIAVDTKRLTSFAGMMLLLLLGFLTSNNPSKVSIHFASSIIIMSPLGDIIFVCFMAKSAFWRGFSALAPYTGVGPI